MDDQHGQRRCGNCKLSLSPPHHYCNAACKRAAVNKRRRRLNDAMKSIGMTKVKGGWE